MKVVLILLCAAATAWAQSCDSSLGNYLNELKVQIDGSPRELEVETRDDFHTLVRKSFAPPGEDSYCYLSDEDLNVDVMGPDGPMKDCTRCQGMTKKLRDQFMHSKPEVRKCFRQHFGQAVREELEPCIQGKISNGYKFNVAPIPDFDEKTFDYIDIVEKGIDYRIMANSRLDACRSVNPNKYQNTIALFKKGYPGIYSKHCQASKNAKAKVVTSSCNARFNEVKGATCTCMDEKREDWHRRFAKIYNIVSTATSASQCGQDISNVIGAWLGKIQQGLSDCLPKDPNKKQTDIRTLIELGCGQVVNGGVKKNELTTGFRFIRLFLDALNDRITMYCNKNCEY